MHRPHALELRLGVGPRHACLPQGCRRRPCLAPGPRRGGGGSQVEVKVGRERSLTSRATVDSAGRRLGAAVSMAQAWPWFPSRSPCAGPGGGCWALGIEARRPAQAAALARALLLPRSCPSRPGGWSWAKQPHERGKGALTGLLAPGPQSPIRGQRQGSGPWTTADPAVACQVPASAIIATLGKGAGGPNCFRDLRGPQKAGLVPRFPWGARAAPPSLPSG